MSFITSTIGRKILMAMSGFFLMVFLLQHLAINFLSVISVDLFNEVSHFMGTNFFVQFILQPILILGFLFHLLLGIYLDFKNRLNRAEKYIINHPKNNSSWVSRNMIITGIMILLFLCLHFYDFWIPEIKYKYIVSMPEDPTRYFHELEHKFYDAWRVAIYCVSFVFLSLHLLHGFASSFQSIGLKNKNKKTIIEKLTYCYSIIVPSGFIFIALFHYINSLTI